LRSGGGITFRAAEPGSLLHPRVPDEFQSIPRASSSAICQAVDCFFRCFDPCSDGRPQFSYQPRRDSQGAEPFVQDEISLAALFLSGALTAAEANPVSTAVLHAFFQVGNEMTPASISYGRAAPVVSGLIRPARRNQLLRSPRSSPMVSLCCEILLLGFAASANLLHCRSPFYLCLEHVDNLGAHTASRPESLLIPSFLNG
jgi:hypothetical protein